MIKNTQPHKPTITQSIKLDHKSKYNLQQKPKKQKITITSYKNNVQPFFEKSSKINPNKSNPHESIHQHQDNKQNCSSVLGYRLCAQPHMNINMDRIDQTEGTNSRRNLAYYKSARDHLQNNQKQNYNISTTCNIDEGLKKSIKSKSNHRKSKQRSTKNRNQKSKSTNTSSRNKGNNKVLQQRTEKVQKSVKMLWQCIGQLWENSRVCQYKSQKSSENIATLKRKLQQQQQKILEIKYQISKAQKSNDKTHIGLRV